MRTLVLAAAAATLIVVPAAEAAVVTVGSTLAEGCYRAAEARDTRLSARINCDIALKQEALTLHDRVGTHVNRGILWMISGELAQANRDFDTALAMDSTEPEAWLNKAIAQMKVGNSREALPLVNKAIGLGTIRPAIAYYVRGVANEEEGNLRAAYEDLKRAAALAPRWDVPAVELARYQVRTR